MADYLAEGRVVAPGARKPDVAPGARRSDDAPGARRSIGTVTNWVGAGLSLALIVGVTVWGYKLLMRDVNGIPVVRATEGPMRMQPETPGGSTADHLGLAVNTVAATGTAAPPPDRLVLAPRPVDLLDEDVATAELMAVAQILPMPQPQPAATEVDPALSVLTAGLGPDGTVATGDAVIENVAMVRAEPDSMSAMVDQILAQVLQGEGEAPSETAAAPDIAVPPVEGGIGQSLRPQVRPASVLRVAAASPAAALGALAVTPTALAVEDVDPDTIPAGTRLVQLGAYDSPEVAKKEWDKLAARFGDYLAGKSRVIQLAESGGRNFYRLRAMGFADINDSRRFCSALVAERAECIPVSAK
ncbi:MAG: SPOR domain-containing protein [Paracoccaceae bacterium]|nr:SPOR domain-containing protein [Paracoccaceae bacterium]